MLHAAHSTYLGWTYIYICNPYPSYASNTFTTFPPFHLASSRDGPLRGCLGLAQDFVLLCSFWGERRVTAQALGVSIGCRVEAMPPTIEDVIGTLKPHLCCSFEGRTHTTSMSAKAASSFRFLAKHYCSALLPRPRETLAFRI